MKILIATEPDDTHALFVKLAVESLGHSCELWFSADMPSKQTNSIYISNEFFDWFLKTKQSKKIVSEYIDVVWWRRPRKPYIPETIHKNDLACVERENSLFHESTPLILAPNAWWVNPFNSIKYANSKIYQLKHAPRFNLKIPRTLISNSAENIKAFLTSQKDVIYKPFFPHNWYENDILKCSYTQKINLNHLPGDAILQMTPGIFQQHLEKSYELRVTCFGEYLLAVKIKSQEHPKGVIDWRVAPTGELKIEPYTLPSDMAAGIRNFMQHLGIVFGCFDFIVTPDGEIYFLEVNQQGQFLWIEDLLPEIKMLDMFVHFVLSKRDDFQWIQQSNPLSLRDFDTEVSRLADIQMSEHVYLNGIAKQVGNDGLQR